MLMYDVNEPKTLEALTKWWNEFKDRAPLRDEDVADFCCVIVGNKTDLVPAGEFPAVMEGDALKFIEGMCPPAELEVDTLLTAPWEPPPTPDGDLRPASLKSGSIEISDHRTARQYPFQRGQSSLRSRSLLRGGTASSIRTALSIYHTPSSSLFENYESARSSPTPASRSPSPPPNVQLSPTSGTWVKRGPSPSSSSSSTPTITPSNFALRRARTNSNPLPSISQQQDQVNSTHTLDSFDFFPQLPKPERRPRLFLTSAKTGEGVSDVFEYIAKRAVSKLEYQENLEARTMHMQESTSGTIMLGVANSQNGAAESHFKPSKIRSCCSS